MTRYDASSVATSRSQVLIDEAETLLTAIRGGVLVHLQDGVHPEHLRTPLDSARTLCECASVIDDETISTSAETLEAWLTLLASETNVISHTRIGSLLDQISELEIALLAYRSRSSSAQDSVIDFLDESFRSLSPAATVPVPPDVTPSENGSTAFDVDAETLEVFSEEAGSILENIRMNLETLSRQSNDKAALWEVRRNAHTLKGAAGVVGLHELSAFAHEVEDLLNRLSEAEAETDSSSGLVDLLLKSTACLTSLADGDTSADLSSRVASLKREFAHAVPSTPTAARGPDTAIEQLSPPVNTPPVPRKGMIVRVSLDRLDDLVKMVRNLESSRVVFEQHIDELARQLEEAYNNRLRLQAASGKIEKHDAIVPRSVAGRTNPGFDQVSYELAETARDAAVINSSLDSLRADFEELYDHQTELIEKIEERLFRLRKAEFGTVATRLQRTVRVTCDEEGKRAEVEIENGSLEVDTQIVDTLIEPLMHLLKNAVVHGIEAPDTRRILGKSETGKITIAVHNEGPIFVMSVTDDGRGIAHQMLVDKALASGRITAEEADRMNAAEVRELVFMPGLTTAENLNLNAGRGVGMTIVRESLEASGGTISIETWPQKGTTFTVRIPNPFAAELRHERRNSGTTHENDPDQISILVVDDSPSVRLMTGRTIENAGWRVQTAKNGLDALEKLSEMAERPNLIISDLEMPMMGGFEFLAALRADPSLKDVPVIVISSRVGAEDRKQALAAGALEYLTKPYDEQQLVELIGRMARRAEVIA